MLNTTSPSGSSICPVCSRMHWNVSLHKFIGRVGGGEWGRLPDSLVPVFELKSRLCKLRQERKVNRIDDLQNKAKIKSLIKQVDDHQRLLKLIRQENIPGLHRQLVVHTKNGGGIPSFIERCQKVVELQQVSDAILFLV